MFYCDMFFFVLIVSFGDWIFDEWVVEVFFDMIQCFVFGYFNIILMIGMLVECFVQFNIQVYDFGCLLGVVIFFVCCNISYLGCCIIVIDNLFVMVECCCCYIDVYKVLMLVEVIEGDICDVIIENVLLVILNFIIQFFELGDCQVIFNKVYQGLNLGGVLVFLEKFSFEDVYVGELLFNMYYDFKCVNGYSELEISQKCSMLENVMLMDFVEIYKVCLCQVGFEYVELWFQCFNFGLLVVVKVGEQV